MAEYHRLQQQEYDLTKDELQVRGFMYTASSLNTEG
jgi:hypothetical protein